MRDRAACQMCGTIDFPRRVTRGSFLIEVVLWIALIVPGLVYSLWRLTTRHNACRACGSPLVVPISSPEGRRIAARAAQQDGTAAGAMLTPGTADAEARLRRSQRGFAVAVIAAGAILALTVAVVYL